MGFSMGLNGTDLLTGLVKKGKSSPETMDFSMKCMVVSCKTVP